MSVAFSAWREADRRQDPWLDRALGRATNRAHLAGWIELDHSRDGVCFGRSGLSLSSAPPPKQTVILSGGYRDDVPWLHVSTAWPNRLPTWNELREVRELFLDDGLVAVQIFPPKAEYINVHPYCLHLYARADARTVPDMRIAGTI